MDKPEITQGEPPLKKTKLEEDYVRGSDVSGDLKPMTEKEVGMTQYLSSHEGYMGTIKQRFSDFLVNEIDVTGNRVVLSDINEPTCDADPCEAVEHTMSDIVPQETLEELQRVNTERKGEVWIPAGDDKSKRGAIHEGIRKQFTCLDSTTTEKDGDKFIKAFPSKSKHDKQKRGWPKGRPEYCKFVMYKQNVDTIEAVNILAKYMRIAATAFTYAGTKDKRAKTSQLITCHRVAASRLYKLNRVLRGITVGNLSYCPAPLKLGDLQGNHFTIILRNVTGSDKQIQQGVEVVKTLGFINYFGMQRFGTTSVPTHHVGRAILHSNWEEAVDLILRPREGDKEHVKEARRVWQQSSDAAAALSALGRGASGVERHLLVGLSKSHKNNLVTAINHIPKNTRLMYLHSYQSFIWNRMVSERLQLGNTKLMPGDLVIPQSQGRDKKSIPETVTEENINTYCIQDLVLPTPGYDVTYPQGEILAKYKALLAEDGLDLNSFKHKIKDYALSGMYRAVISKPTELEYEIMHYSDYSIPLVLSDLEKLKGETLQKDEGDKMKALKLEFTLRSSTYATMLIREVLKCDTSAAFQSTLNVT